MTRARRQRQTRISSILLRRDRGRGGAAGCRVGRSSGQRRRGRLDAGAAGQPAQRRPAERRQAGRDPRLRPGRRRSRRSSTPARPSPSPPCSATRRPPASSPSACGRARTAAPGGPGPRCRSRSSTRADRCAPSPTPSGPARPATCRSGPPAAPAARRRSPACAWSPSTPRRTSQPRGARHRRRAPRGRRRRRHQPRPAGRRGDRRSGHRHPRGVGRRRAPALRVALLLPGQDGLRPPHGRRQHLHPGRRPRAGARRSTRTTPRQPRLERHRLQLPRRPLRHHLRGQVRRRSPAASSGAHVLRLQHRQHRRLGHGHATRTPRRPPRRSRRSSACSPGSSASPASTRPARRRSPAAPPTSTRRAPAVTFPVIAGHRQANYTECPGDAFYMLLPAVRTNVDRRVGATLTARVTASAPLISPNGDGVLDSVDPRRAPHRGRRLAHRDQRRRRPDRRRRGAGRATSASLTWDGASGGRRGAGRHVHRGAHGDRRGRQLGRRVRADHRRHGGAAPRRRLRRRPLTFSPNGDGQTGDRRGRRTAGRGVRVRVGILDAGGRRGALAARLAPRSRRRSTPSPGTAASRPAAASSPPPTASTASTSSAATRPATSRARASRCCSTARSRFPATGPTSFSPNGDGVLRRHQARVQAHAQGQRDRQGARRRRGGPHARPSARSPPASTPPSGTARPARARRSPPAGRRSSSPPSRRSARAASAGGLVVDLTRPRIYAGAARSTSAGVRHAPRLQGHRRVQRQGGRHLRDHRRQGAPRGLGAPRQAPDRQSARASSWKPAARGVYTVTFRATDLAGNREAAPAKTVVTVR